MRADWFRYLVVSVVAIVVAAGAVVLGAAVTVSGEADRSVHDWGLVGILLAGTLIVGQFPIRFGQGDVFLSIDPVPLVMAAIYLPWHDAVLVAAVSALAADWKVLGRGKIGVVTAAFMTALAGLSMSAASGVVRGLDLDPSLPVLLLPALVVAATAEIVTVAFFPFVLELGERGSGRALLRSAAIPICANIFLPTLALVVLSPYTSSTARFALLLPAILLVMYYALWVANSQQLEKKRGAHLRDTFSRYVPETVVGQHVDHFERVELGGEQRDITVLFCDIRGFTSWSENREAGEIITELNTLLSELSAAVMESGGTLDKYTGDGLMAFWGAPLPQEDHAARACEAALEMLRRLGDVNEVRMHAGQEPFAVGVGVHSGNAVVGNVGHEKRLDYTAIGDTVNLAARLEAATKDIGSVLLVSSETVERLPPELRGRSMRIGDIRVKGRRQPVQVWALQPRRPDLDEGFLAA